ncbi:MAG: SdrD B-like domain-containing protein, partial [Bacteroidota bacterium]
MNSLSISSSTAAACLLTTTIDLIACTDDCSTAADAIGGNVFNDFNNDGADAGDAEPGQANIKIEVYDCDGVLQCETWTNAEGNWTCTGLNDGEDYRVEFTRPLTPSLARSFAGSDNGTDVQFTTTNNCSVDFGVFDPNDFCGSNPFVFTPCYVVGDSDNPSGPDDAFVAFRYLANGQPTSASAEKMILADKSEIGSTWGVAYDKDQELIYTSAVLKAQVGLGPTGLGAIYTLDPTGATSPTLLTTIANVGTIPDDAGRGLRGFRDRSTDFEAVQKIGQVGLGDIDISDDQSFLYVTNLFTREVVVVEIATGNTIETIAIPDPACNGGDYRPWGLKVKDGLLYVGVVCDANESQELTDISATVYTMELVSNTFLTQPVLEFPLNYDRDDAHSGQGFVGSARWNPWNNETTFT